MWSLFKQCCHLSDNIIFPDFSRPRLSSTVSLKPFRKVSKLRSSTWLIMNFKQNNSLTCPDFWNSVTNPLIFLGKFLDFYRFLWNSLTFPGFPGQQKPCLKTSLQNFGTNKSHRFLRLTYRIFFSYCQYRTILNYSYVGIPIFIIPHEKNHALKTIKLEKLATDQWNHEKFIDDYWYQLIPNCQSLKSTGYSSRSTNAISNW